MVGPFGAAAGARLLVASIRATWAGLLTIVGPSSANGLSEASVAARITTLLGFEAAKAAIVRGFANGMTFAFGGGCVPRGVRDGALVITLGTSERRLSCVGRVRGSARRTSTAV